MAARQGSFDRRRIGFNHIHDAECRESSINAKCNNRNIIELKIKYLFRLKMELTRINFDTMFYCDRNYIYVQIV